MVKRSIALSLGSSLVGLALLSGASSARASSLVIEGRDFAEIVFTGARLGPDLPGATRVDVTVILPLGRLPAFGTLGFRLESSGGEPLRPGIYTDPGCISAEPASPAPNPARPNQCAPGAFEVFAVRYDADGRLTRLLVAFDSFDQAPFGELHGVLDYRSETDAAADPPIGAPPLMQGSLEIDFAASIISPSFSTFDPPPGGQRPRVQVFDPRPAVPLSRPSAALPSLGPAASDLPPESGPVPSAAPDAPVPQQAALAERNPEPSNAAGPATAPLETAPAPQGARLESAPAEPSAVAAALDAAAEPLRVPATLEPPAPRASSGRPAQATLPVPAPTPRSFLFGGVGGVVPTCCAAARETPEQDVSLPAPPREAVLPAPGPDREPRIETLEGPDAGQIPASSVWTRLDPEPQIVDPDAPRSRSVVPAPSAVAWLWSLVSALLQPLAEIWTAWRA